MRALATAILALAAAAALAIVACKATGTFTCERDDQCVGNVGGRCEGTHYCSFTDSSCPSGQRYDDYAGEGHAGQCVGPQMEIDAHVDDAPAVCMTWHPHNFEPCNLGSPQMAVHLTMANSPYVYDTTMMGGDLKDKTGTVLIHSPLTITQSDSTILAVLSVARFEVDANVKIQVIGPKPLLVASWDDIVVAGDIDVGSHTTETDATAHIQSSTTVGAGANSGCTGLVGMAGLEAVQSGGSGGGGGGALRGAGGAGAVGDMSCTTAPCPRPGGPGGTALTSIPATIRGGCAGGIGGAAGPGANAPANATTIANGGAGGGAIELAARQSINVSGIIRAGGAAGAGAPTGAATGGGGGGSGGMIAFDAPTVTLAGTIAANGGGGGGSAPFAAAPNFGNVGMDGQPSSNPAAGGAMNTSGTCGLGGAAGSSSVSLGGVTATGNDPCGGGGGGGGAGFILYWSPTFTMTGTLSPAPQAGP